jgi:M6 family metalloprotease-like protein
VRILFAEQLEDRLPLDGSNFTSVALFLNLSNPAGTNNAGGYTATTAADIRSWLREGQSPTTSEFIQNYWSELSYGRFQVRVDAVRDTSGTMLIPSITANNNDAGDWGDLAQRVIQANAQHVWRISGSWLDAGVRVIPSVVLVHRFDLGHPAESALEWGRTFTVDEQNYRVKDLFHIEYSIDPNPANNLPWTWGTMAHEYSHDFLNGLDLYGGGGGQVGYWDILGDASTPGRMSNTHSLYKNRLGWLNFKNVLQGPVMAPAEFRLRPYATSGEAIKVVPDPTNNPQEYFLLEFRNDTGDRPWTPDGGIPENGLLITHVNERMGDGGHQAYDSPWIDVEEADGNDGRAWPDDRAFSEMPWFSPGLDIPNLPGDSVYPANNWPGPRAAGTLFPFGGNNAFGPDTNPSSRFYGGRDSGLRITNIRQVGGEIVFSIQMAGNDQSTTTIGAGDQLLPGDFNGDGRDELLAFNGHDLSIIDKRQNQFLTIWRTSDWIGDWNLSLGDRLTVGDFNGDHRSDAFIQSNTGWASVFVSDGLGLNQVWMSGDPAANNNWIGGWHLGGGDKAVAGDFDGDGTTDLFLHNSGWATMLLSTGEGFGQAWMSGDPSANANWIGGWHLGSADRAFVGDYDGDGRDDLFMANSGWAGLHLSTGAGFANVWMSGDPAANENWIGGWHVGPDDRYYVGDFDGNRLDDIFVRSDGWAAMFHSYGSGFNNVWMTGDPAANMNWIDGWHLGPLDRHHIGDLNGDGRDDVFIRNGPWAATLISHGNGLHQEWIYGQLGLDNNYREVLGRFNYDRRADVFLFNGSVTKELVNVQNRTNGTTEMWWGWDGTARLATMAAERPEQHRVGDFNGDGRSDVLVTDGTRLALYLNVAGELRRIWRSEEWIGGWHLGPGDRLHVGDFTGDGKADIYIGSNHWAGLLASTGQSFTNPWIVNEWVDGWHLGPLDREQVGDFNGDGRADIYVRSARYAGLMLSTGSGFTNPWTVSPWVGGWNLGPQDQEYVGDFNNDGRSDIFIRSPRWAGLFLSIGVGFANPWIVNIWVGGWNLSPHDRHYVGDFSGDGRSDIFIRSDGWAGLFLSNGAGFDNIWMTGDPAQNQNWIGGWHLGALDRHFVGDFNQDGRADLYTRSDGWAGVMLSRGTWFDTDFIQAARNTTWVYNPLDQQQVGRFTGVDRDEIYVSHPGGWGAVLTPSAAAPLTVSVTRAHFRTLNSEPAPIQLALWASIDSIFSTIRNNLHLEAFDLNEDRQVNQLDADFLIHDILETDFGDANLDGQFNSSDLVAVFQRGRYEDNIPGGAGWADGDWNGDGEFNSADFVKAFQTGGYELGARRSRSRLV